ncbi:AraC family transcriptional regulator [Paenibacillus sp.]|uniref:AraC family transcriptional regulator n=1 Tax=Paenibacillus sp. TaxID=58172 RepID=UPI002D5824D3|nr:helix-turn-helix domain-containing protein [Paenibacillus sp.]HZG55910.1 helix-turn-helix domain-containing protein [Paenibacillus sp.]
MRYEESYTPPHGMLLADHFVVDAGYYGYRHEGSKDWLLLYTVAGRGRLRLGDEWTSLQPGDAALYPPGVTQHYETAEGGPWSFLWAHFVPEPHWAAWLRLPRTEGVAIHRLEEGLRDRCRDALRRCVDDGKSPGGERLELAMIALSEALALLRLSHARRASEIEDERIADLLEYMARHLHEELPLEKLGRAAGLSVSRVSHLFKERTGSTIMQTLLDMRLRKSCRLLELTSLRIADVAADVGFPSPFYFTRKFREAYGESPSAYRRRVQGKKDA